MPVTMSEQPPSQQRVTVSEAASSLGMSVESVRRLVRQGALKGERVQRGRGWSYLVTLDSAPISILREPGSTEQTGQTVSIEALGVVAAAFSQVMTPLVAQLVDQAETIGRLRAEAGLRRRTTASV